MADYFADSVGGNDANAGTSWGAAKLTLQAAVNLKSANGDRIIAKGTFRETITLPAGGASGTPCWLIGDYTGALTNGVASVVRITGSNDDLTATRANGITATTRSFWNIKGFQIDTVTAIPTTLLSGCTDIEITDVVLIAPKQQSALRCAGAGQARVALRRARVMGAANGTAIYFTHSAAVDDAAHIIENVSADSMPGAIAVYTERVGGITVRSCTLRGCGNAVFVGIALTAGQKVTVRQTIMHDIITALRGLTLGDIDEDYNIIPTSSVITPRSTCNTGANSLTRVPLFDTRPYFEAMLNGGTMVLPDDLSSASQLIDGADGSSASTADARGVTVIGANREPGWLEYDSGLDIEAGSGGGAVSIGPIRGGVGG